LVATVRLLFARQPASAISAGLAPAGMMSSPVPLDTSPAPAASAEEPSPPDGWRGDLTALRSELDRIDDGLHELLMQRARVVEQVAKSGKRSAYRPGREASILRRLLHRHKGALPPQTIVRLWRELLAGTTAMQGPFAVSVYEPDGDTAFTQAAREHFGALTPLHAFSRSSQAMAEVSRGLSAVGVLPLPSETNGVRDDWWIAMLQQEQPRLHIVARLPFWAPRPDGAPEVQALVIAGTEPDPSGLDRSLLGLQLDSPLSRGRVTTMLAAAGLAAETVILSRDSAGHALVEIAGFLTEDDPRLARLNAALRRPVVLGAYAIPETGAAA
jgi:chorismate mutase / prephenate dehydratase